MDTKQLLAELNDNALRDRVSKLTTRMRTERGAVRSQTYRQIAQLLELRRVLGQETRDKLRTTRRGWEG